MLADPALIFDTTFWVVMLVFAGPCLGSFASAILYRSQTGQSWIADRSGAARSCCPHCKAQLSWRDLIPLLSWLSTKGRCRMCGARVSPLYPALEIAALVLAQAYLLEFGVSSLTLMAVAAMPFTLAMLVLSWRGVVLPLNLILILLGGGVIWRLILWSTEGDLDILIEGLKGIALFGGAGLLLASIRYRLLKAGRQGLMTDSVLLAALGVWLGPAYLPAALIVAGVYGLFAAPARAYLKLPRLQGMAHGYIVAYITCLLFGQKLTDLFYP